MIRSANERFDWSRAAIGVLVGFAAGGVGFGVVTFTLSLFFMFLTNHDPLQDAIRKGLLGGAIGALLMGVSFGRAETWRCPRCTESSVG